MSGRVVVEFNDGEGAVVRMLGLIERRGFRISGIAMGRKSQSASLTLDLESRGPMRRLETLGLQLRRLHEVRSVSFSTPAAGAA